MATPPPARTTEQSGASHPALLHEIFEATQRRYPGGIAIEIPPGTGRPARSQVHYAALWERAGRLAEEIRLANPAGRLTAEIGSARPAEGLALILLPREAPDLYAAQLAALRAGAAFVCLDPRAPDAQVRAVIADAAPIALVTDTRGGARLSALAGPRRRMIDVDEINWDAAIAGEAAGPTHPARGGNPPPDRDPARLAYVIYTSGTTGEPKGVMIEHRGIVNLVRSDIEAFGLGPGDRVAQVSSPAYDSSIEEAWLAFAAGATLVLLDDETVRLGPDLIDWLRRERITVLCPPPTLLRSTGCEDPRAALPDLRLLYVGGEALPRDLADRWAAGCRMVNGYGPTECSVTVLRGPVRPGEPVAIGRPVRGNAAWVLDEMLEPVPDGTPGELCIGGVGLARGYLRREALTGERFPIHPRLGRIYRTGDLARVNTAGDFEYLGRIDGQVKLRGYRVELGAIEAQLAACPGVRAAACTVQGRDGHPILAAHILPADPAAPPDFDRLKRDLRSALPDYMVPARFALCSALPTTAGGKLDRAALPDIAAPDRTSAQPVVAPRDPLEARVAEAFAAALDLPGGISVSDDFFLDLGGDSLSAVGVIGTLRAAHGASSDVGGDAPTIREIYEARTAAALAALWRARGGAMVKPVPTPASPDPAPASENAVRSAPHARDLDRRARAVALVQGAWLYLGLVLGAALGYWAAFGITPVLVGSLGLTGSLLLLPLLAAVWPLAFAPVAIGLTFLVKRALIGRYAPARVPIWGGVYARHWMVAQTARLIPWAALEGSIFTGLVLRALGAKVGRGVSIHRGVDLAAGGWDLLAIGDGATLCQGAAARTVMLDDGHVVLGPVTIGPDATIDVRAGLNPDTAVGRGAHLTPLSWLPGGARIPAGERWDGVPAARQGLADEAPRISADAARPYRWAAPLSPEVHGLVMLAAGAARRALAVLPPALLGWVLAYRNPDAAGMLLDWLEAPDLSAGLFALSLLIALVALPATLFLQALSLRALGRVRPGVVSRWSLEAVRIWAKTGAAEAAGRWLSGALLWPAWLRLAGMRIGRGCEISTIIDVLPETVTIGDESFFADGIYFCPPRVYRGTITVAETAIGQRTFLGNHALVPSGHAWPDDLFVGVATVADPARARPGSAWFGHPPFELPRREVVAIDRRLTHEPDALRYWTRVFWEVLRFTLPALPLILVPVWIWLVATAAARMGPAALVALGLPAATLATLAIPCLAVVALKWLLLGRVRPGQHPFWSCWCGRWDFLYIAWGVWAHGILAALEGSLWLNAFLRLTGMRIGRRVVLGRGFAHVVDPDMLHFGDDATVACQLQAHSFEDRVLKIDHLHIERGATVGAETVVFYGARVGAGAHVSPHGVVMKHDQLPAGGRGEGNPVRAGSGE